MDSNILIRVKKENVLEGEVIEVEDYITDQYVYSVTPFYQTIYRKDCNNLYLVNNRSKKLERCSLETKIQEIRSIKRNLHSLDIETNKKVEETSYSIKGLGEKVNMEGEIVTKRFNRLSETAFAASEAFKLRTEMIELELSKDEFVKKRSIVIQSSQEKRESLSLLKEIELINVDITRFDYLLNYPR